MPPEDTFTEYAYFSSYSEDHAKNFVDAAKARLDLGVDSFVVEIASNGGYLLQHVVAAGIPCLGIEPSVNVGASAKERGVPNVTAFLDEPTATAAVRRDHGDRLTSLWPTMCTHTFPTSSDSRVRCVR